MFTVRARRDHGLTTIGFVARFGMAAAIAGVLMVSDTPSHLVTDFESAVCRILPRDDCGGAVPAGGRPATGPPQPVVRPGARPGGGPRLLQVPRPRFPEKVRDLIDKLEDTIEGVFENLENALA